jgi:hypothetical protein
MRPSAPLAKVCYREQLGKLMLVTSFSQADPERRFAEGDGHVNERRRAVIRMSINLRDRRIFFVSNLDQGWNII